MPYHFGPFKRLTKIHFPTEVPEWVEAYSQFKGTYSQTPVGGTFTGIGFARDNFVYQYHTDKLASAGYDFEDSDGIVGNPPLPFPSIIMQIFQVYNSDGNFMASGEQADLDASGAITPGSTVIGTIASVAFTFEWGPLGSVYNDHPGEWLACKAGSPTLKVIANNLDDPDDWNSFYPSSVVDFPKSSRMAISQEPVSVAELPVSVATVIYKGVNFAPVGYRLVDLVQVGLNAGPRIYTLFRRVP